MIHCCILLSTLMFDMTQQISQEPYRKRFPDDALYQDEYVLQYQNGGKGAHKVSFISEQNHDPLC